MKRITLLLLMVFAGTITWSSNTVAAIADAPLMSSTSHNMNDYQTNEEVTEEGGDSDDCD